MYIREYSLTYGHYIKESVFKVLNKVSRVFVQTSIAEIVFRTVEDLCTGKLKIITNTYITKV